jgi:exodeoxyribonuclease VIII
MKVTEQTIKDRPLSFSSIKEFMRSPRHYVKYLTQERKQTEAMLFGAVCHKLILEPQDFEKEYIVEPEFNKRTNQGKEDYQAFLTSIEEKKLTPIPPATMLKAKELVTQLMGTPAHNYVHQLSKKEDRFDMIHETGLPVCGYIDGVGDNFNIEVKIVTSADTDDIIRDFYKMKYHIQAGIYNWANGKPIYYLVIENSFPYLPRIFKASDEYVMEGKKAFNKAMKDFKFCLDTDSFDMGYEFHNGIEPATLTLPGWAKKGGEDD